MRRRETTPVNWHQKRRSLPRRFVTSAFFSFLFLHGFHAAFAQPVCYEVRFDDTVDARWVGQLRALSDTAALAANGAVSMAQLKRRAEKDQDLFRTYVRSQGHYGGTVSYRIDDTADPVTVIFTVDPGPLYLLEEAEIQAPGVEGEVFQRLAEAVRTLLPEGSAARAERIVETDKEILELLSQSGYPLARIDERRVIVNHDTRRVLTRYTVASGPKSFFGPVRIQGLESVREESVRPRLPWKEGDVFDSRLLHKAQNNLIQMDLFSVVHLAHAPSADPQGRLPIDVTVVERKPRTFKGGLFYATDVGPELNVSWENRNLFEGRARVGADSWLSSEKKILEGMFLWRDFLRTDQFVQINGRLAEEDWDAYWSRSIGAVAAVNRQFSPSVRAGMGAAFRLSSVEQRSDRETYGLSFLPVVLHADTTDNPLDPTKGFRLQVQTAPYADVTDTSLFFWKTSTTVSTYYDWAGDGRFILAGILGGGSIMGAAWKAVPADERFYVGGGGSVRGYDYQSLGPREEDTPLGGRSYVSWNGELRWRFRERFGIVGFLDGGTAYEGTVPDFKHSFRWGTGLGFRYYSPLGPFRIDVAVPINRRAGIDDPFQIYVSLGQAF